MPARIKAHMSQALAYKAMSVCDGLFFDSTLTAYIAASLHYPGTIPSIRHMEAGVQRRQNSILRNTLIGVSEKVTGVAC